MTILRMAGVRDAERMLEIYRPYVLETPVSFELESPTLENFQERVKAKLGKFPWLVAELGGEAVGYAYAGAFHTRDAYQWSVETSVYVKRGFHGRRIGSDLYEKLFDILRHQGVVNLIGGITLPNEASVKLHERFGFRPVARFKDAGFKMGQWWDVGYWQLQLEKPPQPKALRPPRL